MLRWMRTRGQLSPHRGRQGEMKAHDGTIVTSNRLPGVLGSGPSGSRTTNAECVGWHVPQGGEPFCRASSRKGSDDSTARGETLALMDHGIQYLFATSSTSWKHGACFSFVEEPETNGVVEAESHAQGASRGARGRRRLVGRYNQSRKI